MSGRQVPEIRGYVVCARCGDPWVLREIASASGGVCSDCFVKLGAPRRMVEVFERGIRVQASLARGSKHRSKKVTDRRRQRVQLKRRAQERAWRRLADRHRAEYEALYAEERAAVGLTAWTPDGALRAQVEGTN